MLDQRKVDGRAHAIYLPVMPDAPSNLEMVRENSSKLSEP